MKHRHLTVTTAVLTLLAGCNSPSDERLSRLVRDTTAEQASQNRAVTELNREAATSHQAVVEAVEESRRELVLLERDLQQQRDRIDDERRGRPGRPGVKLGLFVSSEKFEKRYLGTDL